MDGSVPRGEVQDGDEFIFRRGFRIVLVDLERGDLGVPPSGEEKGGLSLTGTAATIEGVSDEEERMKKRMKYAMLGEDSLSDDAKIAKYTGEVGWKYLKPHYKNGNVLWVDSGLDLREVAKAFTDDQSKQVADWLGCGDLVRVGDLHAEQWEDGDDLFLAVVISPFVLMQSAAEADAD